MGQRLQRLTQRLRSDLNGSLALLRLRRDSAEGGKGGTQHQ
jgi:hypothetical protein